MILNALYLQLEAIASDFMSHRLSVATEFPERLVKTQVADLIPHTESVNQSVNNLFFFIFPFSFPFLAPPPSLPPSFSFLPFKQGLIVLLPLIL